MFGVNSVDRVVIELSRFSRCSKILTMTNTDRQVRRKISALIIQTKKALRETQTLRAGCSKAEPKNFAPPQTPLPGARHGQNLISWRSLPLPKTEFGENRCTQFRVIPPHTHSNKTTDRTDYNTLRRS